MDDATATPTADRYLAPGWFTQHVFNPMVARLTRMGISLMGSRVLEVQGRKSGLPRRTVVNLLTLDGERHLVAPRGTTEWVRNVRAAGAATLRVGRRAEQARLVELADAEKPPVLRAYLDRWGWEVGQFFEGIDKGSSDADLAGIAPGFPVFRLESL